MSTSQDTSGMANRKLTSRALLFVIFLLGKIDRVTPAKEVAFFKVRNQTTDAPLCSLDPPSSSFKVRSQLDCSTQCAQLFPINNCSFNFKTDVKMCELFINAPISFAVVSMCAYFTVCGIVGIACAESVMRAILSHSILAP